MSLKVLGFFVVVVALASPSLSYAQDSSSVKFLIGPIGGFNIISYNTNVFPTLSSEPSNFIAQDGSGIASFFGISSEIPLSSDMHDFLVLEASYDSKSSGFVTYNGPFSDTSTALSASLKYILVNIGFKYNIMAGVAPTGIGVQLCASAGFLTSGYFNRMLTIAPSTNVVTNQVPIDGANSIRFAIRGELTYDILLTSLFVLTPSVGYDNPFTKVDNTDRNWMAFSLYGAIALRYAIGSF